MDDWEFDKWFIGVCGPRPTVEPQATLREKIIDARHIVERCERDLAMSAEWDRRYLTAQQAFRLGRGEKVDKRIKHG